MRKLFLLFASGALFTCHHSFAQISLSTMNNFQDGTLQNWTAAGTGTNPLNAADIGPAGAGDNALVITSAGTGPNANLVIQNTAADWTGNWTTAGVAYLSFWANNTGAAPVTLRVGVDGAGGAFSTINGVTVPAGSGWVQVNIPVQSGNFTAVGGTNVANTLAATTEVRILHSTVPSFVGEAIASTVQVDNIQPGNVPLPIVLSSFRAAVQQSTVTLSWTTQSETQSEYFAVMHSSDGLNWQELARVKAAGNSKILQAYAWKDINPAAGDNYYKLKMVDRSDVATYSMVEVVSVRGLAEINKGLFVYPNPSYTGFLRVVGNADGQFSVYAASGTEVTYQTGINYYSDDQYEINIGMLNPGMYYLKTTDGVRSFIKR